MFHFSIKGYCKTRPHRSYCFLSMFKLHCERHYRKLATYSWCTTWREHVTKTAPARRRHSVGGGGGGGAAAHSSSLCEGYMWRAVVSSLFPFFFTKHLQLGISSEWISPAYSDSLRIFGTERLAVSQSKDLSGSLADWPIHGECLKASIPLTDALHVKGDGKHNI